MSRAQSIIERLSIDKDFSNLNKARPAIDLLLVKLKDKIEKLEVTDPTFQFNKVTKTKRGVKPRPDDPNIMGVPSASYKGKAAITAAEDLLREINRLNRSVSDVMLLVSGNRADLDIFLGSQDQFSLEVKIYYDESDDVAEDELSKLKTFKEEVK